jgi:hypothetical protein
MNGLHHYVLRRIMCVFSVASSQFDVLVESFPAAYLDEHGYIVYNVVEEVAVSFVSELYIIESMRSWSFRGLFRRFEGPL